MRRIRGVRLALAGILLAASGCGVGEKVVELMPKPLAKKNDESIYGAKAYDVQAMLVNRSNKSTPLPALTVYGSPKSVVNKLFRSVIEQYQSEVGAVRRHIEETEAKIARGMTELDAAESKLAAEYAEMRPSEADGPTATSRNPLRELSKVRAAKTKSDEWYKEAFAERITPIKATLQALYRSKYEDSCQLLVLQAGFNNRLFSALETMPASDRKVWKTAENGKVGVTVTNEEPWTVWAVTSHAEMVAVVTDMTGSIRTKRTLELERAMSDNPKVSVTGDVNYALQFQSRPEFKTTSVRWLLDIPDDLDANSLLSLDQDTAFDLQEVSVETGGSDGLYLKKAGRRR